MSTHCDLIEKPHSREAGCICPVKVQRKERGYV
jgi:hypothetical protein